MAVNKICTVSDAQIQLEAKSISNNIALACLQNAKRIKNHSTSKETIFHKMQTTNEICFLVYPQCTHKEGRPSIRPL